MNIILSSDFPATVNPRIVETLRSVSAAPRIAWIPDHTDHTGGTFRTAQQAFGALGLHDLELVDIDEDRDEVQLAYLHEYDVIYLTGEDPLRMRFNANRSGLSGRLRQCAAAGRLIIGASGGALLLTPNVSLLRLQQEPLDTVLEARSRFEALHAVPYEVAPHANRWTADAMARVREYSNHVDHDVVALEDGSAMFHGSAESAAADGRIARYRKGNIIEP
jgi:peptidase E